MIRRPPRYTPHQSSAASDVYKRQVGQGVLSRLVVFANRLFANIAGKSIQSKTDLVVIDTGMGDIESFRSSWREGNF